ncbi:O-methylpimelyl-ACP methylesterase [Mycobacterium antarcticum]|uniref:alpha/beta fold hydrolase n=1 Tax=unclassified Mycolicibacterium TaxID=2636767 RepID=UPI002386F3F5|nr:MULTISPECIES: alpha/beta hydrolase [unclassified Mycolicibacterium]BDX33369.1 O-methylpimelyl-ACP methylesterase [Mycolicibacterium sp. TUM20985]GLP83060.1 O-methylpimelyl-ACP methylesterase [Mycolicibacterium sp. TUM20984]
MTEHLIEVEPGVSIHAQDLGSGDPVVLLHGWALGHEVWDRQVYEFVTSGRRAIAIDLRGHGLSSKPFDGYDVQRLASDVIGVIEGLELEHVTLVGWSLGGLTAFRSAIARPDLFARLVLVCSNGVAASRQPGLPFGAAAADVQDAVLAVELTDRVASREQQIRSTMRKGTSEATIRWLLGLTMRVPSWAGRGCLATVLNTNQVDDAVELGVPLVQILGESDPILSTRAASWLMDHVPVASQVRIPDSGHFPMFENAGPFTDALLAAVGSGDLVPGSSPQPE